MYFHLIGIKEKDKQQYQLDLLIGDGEKTLISDFLERRKVVVISITPYEGAIQEFGKIRATITMENSDLFLIPPQKQFEGDREGGKPLEEALRFLFSLGLVPKEANFLDTPAPTALVESLIEKITLEYQEFREHLEKEQEEQLQKQKKMYEDSNMKHALKVINTNIDRAMQILEVGKEILTAEEIKKITDLSNELKKIRLGSNFNRMVQLLMDTQGYISVAESKVLKQLDNKKFLIDRHSTVTNIDVISEYWKLSKALEKSILKQWLDFQESLYLNGKSGIVFINFFIKDIKASFSSLKMLLTNIMIVLEYLVLAIIVTLSAFWIFSSLLNWASHLPYYLPMFGRLGFLLYLYNQCNLKGLPLQILGCAVVIALYIWGMTLIKATFAF